MRVKLGQAIDWFKMNFLEKEDLVKIFHFEHK
jgi:hypothetical protein